MPSNSKKAPRNAPPKRSLRERAAEVEATAARVLHRAPEAEQPAPPAGPDAAPTPAQILRDRWRAACAAAERHGLTDAEADRLIDSAKAAEEAVIAAPVVTVADLACKVEVLRTHLGVSSLDRGLPFAAVAAICESVEQLTGGAAAENADPILPAIAAHRAAFAAANSQPTEELGELACRQADQAYAALAATTPTTAGGLCALAAHLRRFLRDGGIRIGTTFPEEALTVLLNSADRFAARLGGQEAEDGKQSWAKAHAYAVDLSGLGIQELSNLWDVYASVYDQWQAITQLAFCIDHRRGGAHWPTPAGVLADAECTRAGFVRDRIGEEIRLRTPGDAWSRNVALSLRIKDELLCEGRILDRDLLLEAVKAWG